MELWVPTLEQWPTQGQSMIEIVCASLNFEEDFSIATQSKQNKDVVLLKVQYIFFQFRFIPFQEIFHKVKLYSSPQPAPTVSVHVWHLMDSLNQRKPCIFTISDKSFIQQMGNHMHIYIHYSDYHI